MNLKNITLNERSQSQKTMYCIIAFIENVQDRQVYPVAQARNLNTLSYLNFSYLIYLILKSFFIHSFRMFILIRTLFSFFHFQSNVKISWHGSWITCPLPTFPGLSSFNFSHSYHWPTITFLMFFKWAAFQTCL